MKHLLVLLALVAMAQILIGCDTLRKYRLSGNEYQSVDTRNGSTAIRQKVQLFSGKIIAQTEFNRFNFTFNLYIEFENQSDQTLTITMKSIALYSKKKSEPLEVRKCGIMNDSKFEESDTAVVSPKETKEITCSFDGSKIMKFMQIGETEAQKSLILEIKEMHLGNETQSIKLNFDVAILSDLNNCV